MNNNSNSGTETTYVDHMKSRPKRGYWAGYFAGLIFGIFGLIAAYVMQTGTDKFKYNPRHVRGAWHGIVTILTIIVVLYIVVMVFIFQNQ